MKGYFYIYDEDDRRKPTRLFQKDWCRTKVLKESENKFDSYEEAVTWKSIYNHNYISRAPYVVCYNSGLDWKAIMFFIPDDDPVDMINWLIRRFSVILDVSQEVVCRDKKMEFLRYCKDVLRYTGDEEILKGIIMQISCLKIRYW